MDIIKVAVPLPLGRGEVVSYDYLADPDMGLSAGHLVEVPVGTRLIWGLVLARTETAEIDESRLKYIQQVADLPALNAANISYLERVARWTLAPFGQVLKMMLSVPAALSPPPTQQVVHLPPVVPDDGAAEGAASGQTKPVSAVRQKVIDFLQTAPSMMMADLARESGVSMATVRAMVKDGQLASAHQPKPDPLPPFPTHNMPPLSLTPEQADIAMKMAEHMEGFQVHLLDGVTGSGKTETYFHMVKQAVQTAGQIVILLPEIALTSGFEARFERWFGVKPYIWHSGITGTRKRAIWRAALMGKPMVVVGARSALFLPFSNLSLIIVDEEHDGAFKQEDQVIYHARDMAVMRAQGLDIPVILATATPSIESWVNARQGRYLHWQLTGRYGQAELPQLQAVDLRTHRPDPGCWLSAPLAEAIAAGLSAGEQSLLYLNRRGYAPMAVCGQCGDRRLCYQCDSLLVTHRLSGRQICHHCGVTQPLSSDCGTCGTADSMQLVGPGVERLAEEVLRRFPEARFAVLSSDTLANRQMAEETLRSITEGEVDIIIGTQLVAKGHHFPHLTLVGVVDGDLGLQGGDLRAAERTFQMLMQVAGRAGRGEKPGRALIQTSDPDHPVIATLQAGDRDRFLTEEADARSRAMMPPFGRLAAVILQDSDQNRLTMVANKLAAAAPSFADVTIFGPAPAPIALIRGRHRIRFLIRAPKAVDLQKILKDWTGSVTIPAATQLQLDIDPYNFL